MYICWARDNDVIPTSHAHATPRNPNLPKNLSPSPSKKADITNLFLPTILDRQTDREKRYPREIKREIETNEKKALNPQLPKSQQSLAAY